MAVMSSVRVSYCSHNLYASTTSATAASCGSPNAATCMQTLGLGMVRVHLEKHCRYCSSLRRHSHGQRFILWMCAAHTRSTTSWLDMNSNTPSLANTTNAVAGPRCRVITSGSATTPSRSAAAHANHSSVQPTLTGQKDSVTKLPISVLLSCHCHVSQPCGPCICDTRQTL